MNKLDTGLSNELKIVESYLLDYLRAEGNASQIREKEAAAAASPSGSGFWTAVY